MPGDRRRHDSAEFEESFERFVVSASPRLLRVAFLLTGDRGEAEDLLQGALVRLVGRWRQISDSPEPYALQVLVKSTPTQKRAQRDWVTGTQGLVNGLPFAGLGDIVNHLNTAAIALGSAQKTIITSDRLRAKAEQLLHISDS
jgi:DNA-directed RNA polymerase specialized sigma24 family protein